MTPEERAGPPGGDATTPAPGAGGWPPTRPDPRQAALDLEAAIAEVLGRNPRLSSSHVTATAGPEGLVTLSGTVWSQDLRREVELSCWTVPGVRALHDHLVVGH